MKYSSEFKCLKDKCPNNCCTNTEIKLSVIDMLRLKEAGISDYKSFFNLKTGPPYGVMEGNDCPLLKKGLCTIYDKRINKNSRIGRALASKGLSLRAVPLICRSYPIIIVYPELGELGLNSGCKGVEGMKWEYVIRNKVFDEVVYEFRVYRALIKEIMKNKPMNKLALMISEGKFLKYVLKTLEELNINKLESVSFT